MNDYVGIPFISKGRDIAGADCYGLVRLVYLAELDIELPELVDGYEDTKDRENMAGLVADKALLTGFTQVDFDNRQPFDVFVMRHAGHNCHLSLVVDNNRMLHSESGKGSTIELYNRPHIKPRIKEVWRYDR